MLLRNGKYLDSHMDFQTCSQQQSEFIRSGGLWCPSPFQQVSKQSYDLLAQINALGFLTVDSVDNHNIRPGGFINVHCTVSGFMRSDVLHRLKKNQHIRMPQIGIIHHILVEEMKEEDMLRVKLPVNYVSYNGREFSQANVYLIYTYKDMDSFKAQIHLNPKEPVEFATFVDMRNTTTGFEDDGLFPKLIHALETDRSN